MYVYSCKKQCFNFRNDEIIELFALAVNKLFGDALNLDKSSEICSTQAILS